VTTGGYLDDMTKLTVLKDVQVPFTHFVDAAPTPHASTKHVPVKEAKATLTALLHAVEAGERIVITRHGKPVADLVPHEEAKLEGSLLDRLNAWHKENGTDLSKGWVAPDFDDPLPEDFLYSPWPDDIKMPSDGWKKP
jgi:prevent-host-death family protein